VIIIDHVQYIPPSMHQYVCVDVSLLNVSVGSMERDKWMMGEVCWWNCFLFTSVSR